MGTFLLNVTSAPSLCFMFYCISLHRNLIQRLHMPLLELLNTEISRGAAIPFLCQFSVALSVHAAGAVNPR